MKIIGRDWPGCWQWREFAELWPSAPIVLSVRDPDKWYESVIASIHERTAPGADRGGPPAIAELLDHLWVRDFGGWEQARDRRHAIAAFEAHNTAERADCPPSRLIEWQVEDGWSPLCAALGVPEPGEAFLHLNAREG